MVTDSEKERVRLVELDYASTTDFIKSVVSTATTIRGLAVTIWLALLGFAIQQAVWELAALASVIAAVFLLLDGYHGWLYAEAAVHARAAERVSSHYYRALSKGEDEEDALIDFRAALRAYGFGLFLNIRAFKMHDLLVARPKLFYRFLYPLLIALAAAVAICIATGAIPQTSPAAAIRHPPHGACGQRSAAGPRAAGSLSVSARNAARAPAAPAAQCAVAAKDRRSPTPSQRRSQ